MIQLLPLQLPSSFPRLPNDAVEISVDLEGLWGVVKPREAGDARLEIPWIHASHEHPYALEITIRDGFDEPISEALYKMP